MIAAGGEAREAEGELNLLAFGTIISAPTHANLRDLIKLKLSTGIFRPTGQLETGQRHKSAVQAGSAERTAGGQVIRAAFFMRRHKQPCRCALLVGRPSVQSLACRVARPRPLPVLALHDLPAVIPVMARGEYVLEQGFLQMSRAIPRTILSEIGSGHADSDRGSSLGRKSSSRRFPLGPLSNRPLPGRIFE